MRYWEQNGYDKTYNCLLELGRAYGLSEEEQLKTIKQFTLYDSAKNPVGFRPMVTTVCALDKARDKNKPLSEYAIDAEFSLLYPSFKANLEEECGKSHALARLFKRGDEVYKSARERGENIVKSLQAAEEETRLSYENNDTARRIIKSLVITGAVVGAFCAYRALTQQEYTPRTPPRDEPVRRVNTDIEMDY